MMPATALLADRPVAPAGGALSDRGAGFARVAAPAAIRQLSMPAYHLSTWARHRGAKSGIECEGRQASDAAGVVWRGLRLKESVGKA